MTSLKRHAPAEFNDVDSENIDPALFLSPTKKAKALDFDSTASQKVPRFTLTQSIAPSAKSVSVPQVVGQKRKAEEPATTHETSSKRRVDTSSAPPAPAGRSPKHKRVGILSRHRATGTSYTRINPPASTSGVPFSLNAALAGTVSMKSKSKSSTKGWHFAIHVDTPDDEMANLMEHSTCTLDISDDESRIATKGDRDDKENVPPAGYHNAANIPVTRRDLMTDEARAPLGDLNTKDFYAEGCDANSVIIVPAEESEHADEKLALEGPSTSSDKCTNAVSEGRRGWEDLLAQLSAKHNAEAVSQSTKEQEQSNEELADIQIWESESAKAEDDADGEKNAASITEQQEALP